MNLMTITTKNPNPKKYDISVDLSALERIAGALGLFQDSFLKDLNKSMKDMRTRRLAKARTLKDLR